MPNHHPQNTFTRDRSKIPAVGALDQGATHFKIAPLIQHPADAFNQYAVTGLAKDNDIANPDFTRRERETRGQNIITLMKIRVKAVTADFKKSQEQFRAWAAPFLR